MEKPRVIDQEVAELQGRLELSDEEVEIVKKNKSIGNGRCMHDAVSEACTFPESK